MDESKRLTDQQLYDKVRDHLLAQGKRSRDDDRCLYRGPDGLKCAAGVLIDDAHYSSDLEGRGIGVFGPNKVSAALVASGVRSGQIDLVADLQVVHDQVDPSAWSAALVECAERYGLRP